MFIISSMTHPIYRQIHKKRRTILQNLKIPYTVLLNGTESPIDDTSIKTLIPTDDDEVLFPVGDWIPTMTQKFLMAVRQYFRSFPSEDDIPDYIVRINATVFIYHPKLDETLRGLPKKRVLAGPMYSEDSFVVGMLMIFSKDVLLNILRDPDIFNKSIMSAPDDVALTILARKHAECYNLMNHFVYPDGNTLDKDRLYDLKKIDPWKNHKWYFRICDWDVGEREADKKNFDRLSDFFYHKEVTTPPPHRNKRVLCIVLSVLLPLLVVVVILILLSYWRSAVDRS